MYKGSRPIGAILLRVIEETQMILGIDVSKAKLDTTLSLPGRPGVAGRAVNLGSPAGLVAAG